MLTRETQEECSFELEEDADSDADADDATRRGLRGGSGVGVRSDLGGTVAMSTANFLRASAFYEAAYKQAAKFEARWDDRGRGGHSIGALRSFPWRIAPHLLLELKRRVEHGEPLPSASLDC